MHHTLRSMPRRSIPRNRAAFSLLEVILSLAILAGAMVAIGFLVDVGMRHSRVARASTEAQLLCEAKMSEIAAGVVTVEAVSQAPMGSAVQADGSQQTSDAGSDWLYSVELGAVNGPAGLISVRVVVEQDATQVARPVGYSLVRWIPDPGVVLAEADADAAAAAAAADASAAASAATSSTTGSTGTGSTSGSSGSSGASSGTSKSSGS